MAKHTKQTDINTLISRTLMLLWYLPVMVDTEYAPLVWVDPAQRQDVIRLEQRTSVIGEHSTQLTPQALLAVYGTTQTQWIYHRGTYFLSLDIDAPAFAHASLNLTAQQLHIIIGFNVLQEATITLLRAIIASKSLLIHFSAVPDWVPTMPKLSSGRSSHGGHEEDILALVRSSLPVGFTAKAIADLNRQLDQLSR